MPRHTHHRSPIGHILDHHGIGADARPITHGDGAQHLGACTDHHAAAQRGMALALFPAHSAQRHTLIQRAVVTHHRRLADHHTKAMIDEDPLADGGTGVNLDPGQQPPAMGHNPCQRLESSSPQAMGQTMAGHGVHARIGQRHLQHRMGRRVPLEDVAQATAQVQHHNVPIPARESHGRP